MRQRIADNVINQLDELTVLGGDFNYVITDEDRVSLNSTDCSGRRDAQEESHFQAVLGRRHGFFELFQGEYTHSSASARSRLDRVYFNYHVAEQLDRSIQSTALEWLLDLSHHRAVRVARHAPQRGEQDTRPIPMQAFLHQDFHVVLF